MTSETKPKKRLLLKIVLVILGVPILFVGSIIAILAITLPSPQGKRVSVQEQLVGIYAQSFSWMLRTPQGVILIDTGMDREAKSIKSELKKRGLTAKDVKYVLLTHGHVDHISGLFAFPHAKVWIGPGETKLIDGKAPLGGLFQRTLSKLTPKLPKLPQTLQELKDGQELTVAGEKFRVVHTPGHTRGSVMYLWKDILFTGDTVACLKEKFLVLPFFMMEDVDLAKRSLSKLKPLSFSTAVDGHVGMTQDAHQKLLKYLQ